MNPVHPIDDQTARIELTPGYAALVDQASLWLLLPYRWRVHKVRGKLYARTHNGGKVVYMHRLLLQAPANSRIVVDHRNGDGLDNRQTNLRLTTRRQKARISAAKRHASPLSDKTGEGVVTVLRPSLRYRGEVLIWSAHGTMSLVDVYHAGSGVL